MVGGNSGGSIEESVEHFGSGAAAGVKLGERSLREDGGVEVGERVRRMGVEGGEGEGEGGGEQRWGGGGELGGGRGRGIRE